MAVGNTFGRFFNDSDLDQVENFINGILSTPDVPRENDNERISSDFLNNFFEEDENNKNKSELDQVLSQFSVPAERLLRYNAYDEIYKSVAMIRRIIKVYKSNIIQKNPVNGLWYLLRKTDFSKDKNIDTEQWADLSKKYYEGVLTAFKIQHYLKNLYLHDQLVYGNCLIEVVDLKKETDKVDLKKISILNEVNSLEDQVNKFSKTTPDILIEDAIKTIANSLYKVVSINEEIVGKVDEESKIEEENSRDLRFKNVLIRTHKPHNIIILETKYRTTLGYLEVCRDQNSSANNITKTLSSITSRISSVISSGEKDTITSRDEILNRIIKYMLKKVTNSEAKFNDEVIQNLKRFVVEQNYQNQQSNLKPVEVRFIPVNRIINFSFPSSENYPYGGSVIEPLLLPGKLFILSQLSNIYMKLSRAPLTRKWIIDES